jgi:hypothetical protein
MATRTRIPAEGVTVPAPCPVCGQRLTWQGRSWRLTCSGCGLAGGLTLHPDEARDLAWYLSCPVMLEDTPLDLFLAACLAVHHLAAADVEPEPVVISTKPTPDTHKARILPIPGETPEERAERLGEQARLNGIGVVPIAWNGAGVPYRFRVDSGERDEHNQPVRRYEVEVTAFRAYCPCMYSRLCCHLLAVKDWLVEWDAAERAREIAPPLPVAKAPVAYANTGKYAGLWED